MSPRENPKDSTEEKIKEAAKKVFHSKGYAAARTRDIAEEAGINIALLNYYFRSKEKLFSIIMLESFKMFISSVSGTINNPNSTLQEKVQEMVSSYTNLLSQEPDLPLFIISELRTNPQMVVETIGSELRITESILFQQIQKGIDSGEIKVPSPFHFMMNTLSLTVFPFIAKTIVTTIMGMAESDFKVFTSERESLIPEWIEQLSK